MTLRDYIEIIRDRWRLVLAGLVMGLLTATVVTALIPRQYSASVTMIVTAVPSAGFPSEDVSAQRVQTYVELLRTKGLAADVVATMKLDVTADDLASRITVTSSPETALLTAAVTSDSPDVAIDVANAVATEFIRKVSQLEQPVDPASAPAWQAKVFEPATPPAEMITPRPVLYLLVGASLGVLAGIAAALLGNSLSTSLKRRSQLEHIMHAPVLGIISRDSEIARNPSVIYGHPQATQSEAFRRLRANLQLADFDRTHKVILVTGASPGEGKTTVLCNLASALAENGSTVLVVEADRRQPRAADVFGINRRVGLANVLVDGTRFERFVVRWNTVLDVVPSGAMPPNPENLLGSPTMAAFLADARSRYDVVLLDSSPLLPVAAALPLLTLVDGVLLVVRYGAQLDGLHAARAALNATSVRLLGTVMTMVPSRKAGAGHNSKPALRIPPGSEPGPPEGVAAAEPTASHRRLSNSDGRVGRQRETFVRPSSANRSTSTRNSQQNAHIIGNGAPPDQNKVFDV